MGNKVKTIGNFWKKVTKYANFPGYCKTVRLCSEGVTKLFPKGFDRQNNILIYPHGKRKTAPELHSILNPLELFFYICFIEKP